jgi:hypothetical protein
MRSPTCPRGQHTMVAAALRQAFLQPDRAIAHQTWRQVADQLRPRWPKLAALMGESEQQLTDLTPGQTAWPELAAKPHATPPSRAKL